MVYREKQYNDTLCHFNPNHDPRNGRFAKGSVLDRLEQRRLENKVSKAAKKESKRTEKLKHPISTGLDWIKHKFNTTPKGYPQHTVYL